MHVYWLTINVHGLDWIEQCFTSLPTQYRLYGRRFLQVKRPNQQYQSTEGNCKCTCQVTKLYVNNFSGNIVCGV